MSEAAAVTTKAPAALMKQYCANQNVQAKLEGLLGESKNSFVASLLDLYTSDSNLMACDPALVMAEAMKAAVLKLPITKSLGFAYIVPFKDGSGTPIPTFIMGYRGYIQLAMRTGQYRSINADCVYEGETAKFNRVTGMLEIAGEAKSDKAIGYFAYFEMLNGFYKAIYWTREKVTEHAKKKSKSWRKQNSPWHTDFDAMACKTMLRQILSKYGFMSVEFMTAIAHDVDDEVNAEVDANGNGAPLVIEDQPRILASANNDDPADMQAEPAETVDQETGEIIKGQPENEPPAPDPIAQELDGLTEDPDF